ncbi:glycosyltransferase family 2 protein [Candidatus Peregrinibacteria bacterium]|jgi:glycosyltransferase involved in cell wall biosynthesis|nr:glycosyltransferase family 2 protein [Candidatus Peregrinibacteria bacterium]MBT3598738.1 glycosyltransferase family 2 protein [Candidatus Peregrinibacteria bacterium]MBT6731252.1 glycosyltransferase family 2 protein [Candidatus Peregrinibacteria bacterium]MBT7008830.1 glycosyltransferase family 2 protein [Candidatus Peregrinibacteria bacterium]MBT7344573.1 glycosyltransferase family 2 protein [Candidatus Peregrinibacteria bacterium]
MSDLIPISVHILTYNSGETLENTLMSIKDCEEILVIDGDSTDNTLDIASKYNAKVISQETTGKITDFSSVRNLALANASKDWIFALDSDEVATEEILESMKEAVIKNEIAAFYVIRKYVLNDGRVVDFASTYPNKRLYFFNKKAINKWIKPVHERPELCESVPVYDLEGACLAPLGNNEDYWRKNNRYLKLERQKSKNKGWKHWLVSRLFHTTRSRSIALIRIMIIWGIPRKGVRLPLRYEIARLIYGLKLIYVTCPLVNKK